MYLYLSLMTQRELCSRWQLSEATLERWRSEAGTANLRAACIYPRSAFGGSHGNV